MDYLVFRIKKLLKSMKKLLNQEVFFFFTYFSHIKFYRRCLKTFRIVII